MRLGKTVYIYIDESGDLGEQGTEYLVICALWVEDVAILDKVMKKIRRQKRFKKFLSKTNELHANSSSDEFRIFVLKLIGSTEGINYHAVVLRKKKIFSSFLLENKHKLYNYVCGHLAANWNIPGKNLIVRIDKSKGSQMLQQDFNEYLDQCIERSGMIKNTEFHHSYSHAWPGLQFVDFVAWSVYRKHEREDERFFRLIEKKTSITRMWE